VVKVLVETLLVLALTVAQVAVTVAIQADSKLV
jgi:hypothetical protein